MKLTTKLLWAYIVGSAVIYLLTAIFVAPAGRQLLAEREVASVQRFLQRTVDETAPATSTANVDVAADLFVALQHRFNNYFTYNSGRLLVLNRNGEVVGQSAPGAHSRSNVSQRVQFDGGGWRKLVKTAVADRSAGVKRYHYDVVEATAPVARTMFVAYVPSGDSFVCVTVTDDDLYFGADLFAQSVLLCTAIVLLLVFVIFRVWNNTQRRRYDAILAAAEQVAGGRYDIRVNDDKNDEIGVMARTIDQLADNMQTTRVLEDQLRRSQKMQTVGSLASGVAHDFNNLLGGIGAAVDIIRREFDRPSDDMDEAVVRQMVGVVTKSVSRGRDTVDQLLTFSRRSEPTMSIVDLNQAVGSVDELCRSTFDKQTTMHVVPHAEPATIKADRSALEQAILNICINARDSITGPGTVTMTVTPCPPPINMDVPAVCEKYYRLTIADTGCGMASEVLSRLFEPFFTTKAPGKGTGLGMAMVYKMVDEHGGWIDVDSTVDVGTQFDLYFPKVDGPLPNEPAPAIPTPHGVVESNGASVLVIEDDKIMRELCANYLRRDGFKVVVADDGKEGVQRFDDDQEGFDAVLLDLVLPGLAGEDVLTHIRSARPDICVLVVTGTALPAGKNDIDGADGVLKKPFAMDQMTAMMKTLLSTVS